MTIPDTLLDAARAGDAAALDAVVREYQPRAWRFVRRMCRNGDDAQDVLQETLLAMARGLPSFRGASSVSTWLFTIARSFCIKNRRRTRRTDAEVPLEDAPATAEMADPAHGPLEEVERRRLHRALDAAIASLAPGYREVLVLRDVEGLTAPEVAQVTGLSVEAVKSRLHRARAAVREHLAPALGMTIEDARGPACPDVVRTFSRFLEGEIGPAQCAEMERHLAGCRRCTAACEALKRTLGICRAAPTPALPAQVEEAVRAGLRRLLARV